jgi:UDP-N-acetyl-D-mannosaminuronic acid dehydrogenase
MQDQREIVISGGGYVGLVGAVHFALAGCNVTIYDPDPRTVNGINSGQPRAGEYLSYIDENVATLVKNKKLKATTAYDTINTKMVHLLAVPTEKGDTPDMSIVKSVITKLHESLPKGGTIIVESTVQPGTIDSLDLPRVLNNEIYLAVCPRLDWFADSTKNVTTLPRIVGGVTEHSTIMAANIVGIICKDVHKTNHRVAEFAKAGQNHLYFVQIMAAYEMARAFQGDVDMNEALKFIGLHWRLPELFLGPGVSGRCIQMGTQYLVNASGDEYMDIANEALEMNEEWRDIISTIARDKCSKDGFVLVMGISYRPNFSDFGYSSGLCIANTVNKCKRNVEIHDAVVHNDVLAKTGLKVHTGGQADVIVLATGHDAYKNIPCETTWWKKGQTVIDCCGLWEQHRKLFDIYGVNYIRVGEQGWMNK